MSWTKLYVLPMFGGNAFNCPYLGPIISRVLAELTARVFCVIAEENDGRGLVPLDGAKKG